MSYLAHITLHSGHIRDRSPRSEVDDAMIDLFGPIMAAAESGEPTEIVTPDETWMLRRLDPADGSRHTRQWALGPRDDQTVALVFLGMKSGPGAGLWRHIHRTVSDVATRADDRPPAPWLAAYIDWNALIDYAPGAAAWLGDAERTLAWAWIEHCYSR